MKPRLALVTHVDWGHIRQRPHQLAAALAAHYDVTVIAPVSRKLRNLVRNPRRGITLTRVWRLPGSYRSGRVARANAVLARAQCRPRLRRAETIVVTSPELWPWVQPVVGMRTLVYDCMDDALAFAQSGSVHDAKAAWERELLARADVIACASEELVQRCVSRGAPAERVLRIPNGWDPEAFPIAASTRLPATGPFELAYFGTIERWLDVEALRTALESCPDLSIRLIGPNERADLRGIDRLAVDPPWPHEALATAVSDAHGLVMPFRIDALTRAVDPVKLYEYIALGKPIVASYWPELDRFAPFVTFYRDAAHFASLLQSRSVPAPPSIEQRRTFLEPQTWAARGAALHAAIGEATR